MVTNTIDAILPVLTPHTNFCCLESLQVNVEIAEQEALVNQRNQEGIALAQLVAEEKRAEGVKLTASAEAQRIQLLGEAEVRYQSYMLSIMSWG